MIKRVLCLCVLWIILLFFSPFASASDQVVKFTWDRSPETEVIGYQLYRSEKQEGPYAKLGGVIPQVAENVELIAEDSVPYVPGTSYFYVITAQSAILESGQSNPVAVSSLTTPTLRVLVSVIVEVNQ